MSAGWRTSTQAFACAVAGLFIAVPATHAKPGMKPDRAAGGDGTVATALPIEVTDAALDPQGRTVLGGIRFGQPAVARLLPDGTPDASFGGDGESHEGSVNETRDVEIKVLRDGSVQALALVETGEDKYLRIDFSPVGAQTGAVSFDRSGGAAGLTPKGGAIATRLEEQLETRRYNFLGAEVPGFDPGGQPQSFCAQATGCHYFFPDELTVGPTGTIVQSVDSLHTNSPCDGAKEIQALAPRANRFRTRSFVSGCGVNDVFSIASAPDRQFLVSAWGAPPSRAEFIRLNADGSLDRSFGEEGVARTADLNVDNLYVSDPAIVRRGAFYNSMTQPREPTLRLQPSRFSAAGVFSDRFAARTRPAEFGAPDGVSEFHPQVTLRSQSKRVTIAGTGQTQAGPVVAIARWRPR